MAAKPTGYAALLRGINLGARNRVAMADLRAIVEGLGAEQVNTYVQSGNVVLRSALAAGRLAAAIEEGIRKDLGLDVPVIVRTAPQLRALVKGNPFAGPKVDVKTLHVTFLASKPAAKRVADLRGESFEPDALELVRGDVCLSCPNGYGRTKLGNTFLERRLGVPATTRNWRTVTMLADLTAGG
jgi:uncharacterized protein (DUF1697 family)